MTDPVCTVPSFRVGALTSEATIRAVPEETPVALVYDGTTQAVMMATPADLEDFAIGFSFTEGQIERASDITELTIVEQPDGIEARMWLVPDAGKQLINRRRAMAGATGCGLCGVESLAVAVQPAAQVADGRARLALVLLV